MNRVMLIGNLTRDPELRMTNAGIPVCNFSIAVNRRMKSESGNQETDFFNIVAWRQLAELCSKYLAKGRKVAVYGSVQMRSYEAKDGTKRTTYDIKADEVEFLSRATDAQEDAYLQRESEAIKNEPEDGRYKTAVSKNDPSYTPADSGFTQVDDDELPFDSLGGKEVKYGTMA